MMRLILIAAAFTLAACGNNRSVMDGVEDAQSTQAETSREVQEAAQTLPSGLQLQFVRRGVNDSLGQPTMNATVLVHYAGSLVENGEEFDSSFVRGEPAAFPLQQVVAGFAEAITHMRPGDEVIATFPGSLGYGPSGQGPIPPNAALRFRIVLLGYQEPGQAPVELPQ